MHKENSLFKQGIILSIIAVFTSLLAFVKEAVFANYFGVSSTADAYTIAMQLPEILFAVVWGAIYAVVIPLYTERLQTGDKQASRKFISNLLTILCLASVIFIVFSEFLADVIVNIFSPGLPTETHDLAVSLLRWIFPVLIFEGITRVCTGVLNVHKQFVIPRILPAVRNIILIVFLVLFINNFGIYAAAYGVLCGAILEGVVCYFATLRKEKLTPYLDFRDTYIKRVGRMIVPVIIGIGVSEINHMTDKIIASFLDAGSISSLNYAYKLSSIIETIFLSNIVTVLYPEYSSLAAAGRKKELVDVYVKSVRFCLLLCIPLAFGGIFFSDEIVSLAFERGAFDSQSVSRVALLFAVYLLNLIFATVNGVSVKLFNSCSDTKTPMINSSIGVAINIVLNFILASFFGVVGLVIATLISTIFASIRLLFLARRRVFQFQLKPIVILAAKSVIGGACMFMALFFLREWLIDVESLNQIYKAVYCIVGAVIGVGIYGIMLLILNVTEAKALVGKVLKKKA